MGVRWGGERGERRSSDNLTVGLAGALVGGLLASVFMWAVDDDPDPREPTTAEIDAAVMMNAAVIEMHGYGSDGQPGEFLYDCRHAEDPGPGEPTLVCTQREAEQ